MFQPTSLRLVRPALAALLLALAPAAARAARGGGDVNGDGVDDLVVGVLNSDEIHVLFGVAGSGLGASGTVRIHMQDVTPGAPASAGFGFGETIALGDFDGDGFTDLAIGAPRATVATKQYAGAVYVVHGSAAGLDLARVQVWNQNTKGVPDQAEGPDPSNPMANGERFGSALAAGDFNGDGYDDLAIGVADDIAKHVDAGAVHVLRGSAKGLRTKGGQFWHANKPGIAGKALTSAYFGGRLLAGDLNGDGVDDLVIGTFEFDADGNTGRLRILYGKKKKGLRAKGSQAFDFSTSGQTGANPSFGRGLAIGDFDGDAYDDLAVGVPQGIVQGIGVAGLVCVYRGTPAGLGITAPWSVWHQSVPGVLGATTLADNFGAALAAGNVDGDAYDDLIVGIPYDDEAVVDAGAIQVLRGNALGLTASGNQLLHQDTPGIGGIAEAFDTFGSVLACGDFDGDGADDVAVGVPGDTVAGLDAAGAVNEIRGQLGVGLDAFTSALWHKNVPGMSGSPAAHNNFGSSLGR